MLLLLFLLGTATGSFLNVLAMRYEEGGRIFRKDIMTGRSHCPYCKKVLRWYELVPLFSYVLQLGKCRSCGQPLSAQYPTAELLGGLIVLLSALYLPAAPIWMFILFTFLLITLIDLRLSVIPDQLNLFLCLLAVALVSVGGFSTPDIINRLIGAAVGFGVFGIIILVTKGKGMGIGDWKMAIALGLLFGWPKIALLIGIAFILGGIAAVIILAAGKKKLRDSLPFGPFLVLASVLILIFGDLLIKIYL